MVSVDRHLHLQSDVTITASFDGYVHVVGGVSEPSQSSLRFTHTTTARTAQFCVLGHITSAGGAADGGDRWGGWRTERALTPERNLFTRYKPALSSQTVWRREEH